MTIHVIDLYVEQGVDDYLTFERAFTDPFENPCSSSQEDINTDDPPYQEDRVTDSLPYQEIIISPIEKFHLSGYGLPFVIPCLTDMSAITFYVDNQPARILLTYKETTIANGIAYALTSRFRKSSLQHLFDNQHIKITDQLQQINFLPSADDKFQTQTRPDATFGYQILSFRNWASFYAAISSDHHEKRFLADAHLSIHFTIGKYEYEIEYYHGLYDHENRILYLAQSSSRLCL